MQSEKLKIGILFDGEHVSPINSFSYQSGISVFDFKSK